MEKEIITHELLKSWSPCKDGYKRFCELFPDGSDLETAINGLVEDGHDSWGYWLFKKCIENSFANSITSKGYRNTGYRNSGDCNTGDWNSGDRNTGDCNTGDCNTGDRNSGDCNTGDWNSGNCNTGDWNSGYRNNGFFNTKTPETILVFNKPCSREKWEEARKPSFLFFGITRWINDEDMTEEEKANNQSYKTTGGYLKQMVYKEAFQESFKSATKEDIQLLKALPNFDADVFFEISGIRIK